MQATITEVLPANAQINNVVLRRNLRAKMVQKNFCYSHYSSYHWAIRALI